MPPVTSQMSINRQVIKLLKKISTNEKERIRQLTGQTHLNVDKVVSRGGVGMS